MSDEFSDDLGRLIDRLDNLDGALQLPLRAEMHVSQLKKSLPEIVNELKAAYVAEFGENPWE